MDDLLSSLDFLPGVNWFQTNMHDTLFQHSIFGAITFLILSHTDVYKFVGGALKIKDKNILSIVHGIVFAIVMYVGSLYLFYPLMIGSNNEEDVKEEIKDNKGDKNKEDNDDNSEQNNVEGFGSCSKY